MILVRRIARPLLASIFVTGGLDQFRHPGAKMAAARPMVKFASDKVSAIPNDPELLVRTNGALMVGAGALLATGKMPRTSAALLATSLVPTTFAAHDFWTRGDEGERAAQRVQFFKNASVLGGLLIAAVDTEGKPGLAYRSHLAKVEAGRTAERTRRTALRAARQARKDARRDAQLLKLRAQQALPSA